MLKRLMKNTVTVYHKTGEDSEGRGIYERYVLKNVRFEKKEATRTTTSGLLPYNSFKLYVNAKNCSKLIYAQKNDYAAMTESGKEKCWTVSEGDMITNGVTNFSEKGMSVDEMKEKCEVFTVISVAEDRIANAEIITISGRGRVFYE